MDDRDYDDDVVDKQWANKYILGPLYEPEPSQLSATRISPKALPPTPPADSPARRYSFRRSRSGSQENEDPDEQPFMRRILSRSNSVNKALPPSPPPRPKQRPLSELERKRSVHTSRPPQTRWNQGTILARSNSVATSRPSIDEGPIVPSKGLPRRRGGSLAERFPGDRSHRPLEILTQEHRIKEMDPDAPLPRRGGSLRERYPGDMSHRPLDMIKREHRAADRAPHLHTHRRQQPSDPIDSLDHTGPIPEATYHHDGPFDPTMKSRNTNKLYSPIEAVKDTNIEALKATPAEFLMDSLGKHVPLQGTAVVPPGMQDMSGRKMEYQEGADLMREKDAAGGAYKRWDHVVRTPVPQAASPEVNEANSNTQPYTDDDYKGKGEPSFTIEKDAKARQLARKPVAGSSQEFEMQAPTASGRQNDSTHARHRSAGLAEDTPPPLPPKDYLSPFSDSQSPDNNLRRSNTTGKSLAQMLKRGFGSLRRKKPAEGKVY